MKWLDRISILAIAIIAIPLALAPFTPEPHIVEKLRLLIAGNLTSMTDIFDLLLHSIPAILLLIKLVRTFTQSRQNG